MRPRIGTPTKSRDSINRSRKTGVNTRGCSPRVAAVCLFADTLLWLLLVEGLVTDTFDGMRAIWIPHSDLPAAQRVQVTAVPDATAHELLDVLRIVDGWTA